MRRLDIGLLGVAILIGGIAGYSAIEMGLTQFGKPGSGLFPLIISALLIGFSVVAMAQRLATWEEPRDEAAVSTTWDRFLPATVYAALLVYTFLLPRLGFTLSSVLMTFFFLKIIGRKGLVLSLALSFGLVVPLAVIFQWFLKVELPTGLFPL